MNILQVTDELPPYIVGGSGRIAWETSVGLASRGHAVHALTAAPDGTFPASSHGVTIQTLPQLPRRFAHYCSALSSRRAFEVLKIIEAVQPDIIHIHGVAWHLGYGWIASASQRSCIIYTAHGVMHVAYGKVLEDQQSLFWTDIRRMRWEYNPLRNLMVRRALGHCSSLLSVSDALRKFLERHGYANMRTVHNGIDCTIWQPSLSQIEARVKLGLPQNRTIFLLAGRLGHDKGSDVIDATLPNDALLLAAGDVPTGTFRNGESRVRVFPRQSAEDMRTLYAACDATLVPSVYLDPFPTVCLESMACARPVIATTHGGAREAVADGVAGWLVDPQNTQALSERLQWCVNRRADLPAFGMAARQHVAKEFSLDRYLDTVTDIYKSRS